jgi:ribonuclease VapC
MSWLRSVALKPRPKNEVFDKRGPMSHVLDASVLLAYLRDEPGAAPVADAIADGTYVSAVNLAEVLGYFTRYGAKPDELVHDLVARGLLGLAIAVEQFTQADAIEVARMRPITRELGLSLGDLACLALTRRLGLPALTADAAWRDAPLGLEVILIR